MTTTRTIADAIADLTLTPITLEPGEAVSDVVIIARVTRLTDGRTTTVVTHTDSCDIVTQLGLLEAGRQITNRDGWTDVDEDQ